MTRAQFPFVGIDGTAIREDLRREIVEAWVDDHLVLPDAFLVRFRFDDPAMWDSLRVPLPTDTVAITAAGAYSVALTGSDSVDALTIGGVGTPTLVIGGSANVTLSVARGVANDGVIRLTQTSGCCTGRVTELRVATGTITNKGLIEAISGAFGGTRTVTGSVDNQGAIRAQSNLLTVATTGSILTSTGTLTASGSQILVLNGTSLFGTGTTIQGTGTVRVVGTMSLATNTTFPTGGPALDLSGSATVNGPGMLILQNSNSWGSNDVINAPLTIDSAGAVTFGNGSPTLNGALVINAFGTMTLNPSGGTATVTATSTFSNAGTITLTQASGCCTGRIANLVVSNQRLLNTGLIRSLSGAFGGDSDSDRLRG